MTFESFTYLLSVDFLDNLCYIPLMVRAAITLGSVIIGLLEIWGFFALHAYFDNFGIEIPLSQVPLFELPRFALYALNAAPPQVATTFSIMLPLLLLFVFVEFAIKSSSDATPIVRYDVHPQASNFIMFVFDNLYAYSKTWRSGLRFFQIVFLIALLSLGISAAVDWGFARAQAVVAGEASELRPDFNGKSSISLIPAKGTVLPPGITAENTSGALTLIWQDDKTYYVAAIHKLPNIIGGVSSKNSSHSFDDWFAIERSGIAAIKHNREIVNSSKASGQVNSVVANYLTLGISCVILIIFSVSEFRRSNRLDVKLRVLGSSELSKIESLAPVTARFILDTMSNGKDCVLNTYQPGRAQRIWLRRETFENGLVLSEELRPRAKGIKARSDDTMCPRSPE